MCSTNWDMRHKLCPNSKTFQGQSFTSICSKSKLRYNVTKVNPNLVDNLEILKLDTHLSTDLRNCPYCVEFMNHKQKIRYFAII